MMTARIPRPRPLAVLGVGVLLTAALAARSAAQQDSTPPKSARGGMLARTQKHQFEVFFYKTGLRIFPQTAAGAPVALAKLTGTATFTLPGAPQPFVYGLHGDSPLPGLDPGSIDLALDLSGVPAAGAKVAFAISGLPDPSEQSASFSVPFELAPGQAAPATSAASASQGEGARYYYGPGYYGYSYYNVPAPGTVAVAPAQSMSPPAASYRGGSGAFHDPGTGRDYATSIGKPWLRPY